MDEKTKKWYKKWWIWVLIVVILLIISSLASTSDLTASSSYTTEAHKKGDKTGYTKELGNGTFVVGEDIDAGLYNVEGLGWADTITMSNPIDIVNQNDDGTSQNIKLVKDQEIDVLDQTNSAAGSELANDVSEDVPIKFTQIYSETTEDETIEEKIDIKDDEEICYKNDEKVDCNDLKDYDNLKKEAMNS